MTERRRARRKTGTLVVPRIAPTASKAAHAAAYARAGFYILPVAARQKNPGSLVGGAWQTKSSKDAEAVAAWWARWPNAEIALHCGRSGLVVFDVDYPEKVPPVLAAALPGAPQSTTRAGDVERGHYLFALPPGVVLGNGRGALGKEWGEVRGTNGVIILPGSEHEDPDTGLYAWRRGGAVPVLGDALLAALPRKDANKTKPTVPAAGAVPAPVTRSLQPAVGAVSPARAAEWVAEYSAPDEGGWCPSALDGALKVFREDIAAGSTASRHDAARDVACMVAREALAGAYPADLALSEVRGVWAHALGAPAGGRAARPVDEAEWERIVCFAVEKALAVGDAEQAGLVARLEAQYNVSAQEPPHPRERDFARTRARTRRVGLNDTGNAQVLYELEGEDLRFLHDVKQWRVWDADDARWYSGNHDAFQMSRSLAEYYEWLAKKERVREQREEEKAAEQAAAALAARAAGTPGTVEAQKAPAKGEGEGFSRAKLYWKWAETCGNNVKMEAALKSMSTLPEVAEASVAFDSDENLINCKNGVLELKADGHVELRPGRRSDRCSLCTNVDYLESAASTPGGREWQRYLDLFLPDADVQAYVQRLVGYSLAVGNPDKLVIFLKGKGNSGKTTFVEMIKKAFGEYAGAFSLSLLQGNTGDRGRPDIIAALPKRLLISAEASTGQKLHVDVIKKLSGNDTVTARNLYANEAVSRTPAFTCFIATNDVPSIPHADQPLRNRLRVIPFDVVAGAGGPGSGNEEIDHRASRRMLDQPDAVAACLAWAVAGWAAWAMEGMGEVPVGMTDAASNFERELSAEHEWAAERLSPCAGSRLLLRDVYEDYEKWATDQGYADKEVLVRTKLTRWLNANGYEVSAYTQNPNAQEKRRGVVADRALCGVTWAGEEPVYSARSGQKVKRRARTGETVLRSVRE